MEGLRGGNSTKGTQAFKAKWNYIAFGSTFSISMYSNIQNILKVSKELDKNKRIQESLYVQKSKRSKQKSTHTKSS